METQALLKLRNHAEGKLWPFPDRMQHLQGTETDFYTESFIFYTNIELAFRELQDNIAAICTKDEAIRYADNAIEYLQNASYQVNQFFVKADSDYNNKLQQIEAEGVSESPASGLTPVDSISEYKLEYPAEAVALYVNKICLWGISLFQQYSASENEPPTGRTPVKLKFVCQNKQVYNIFWWLKAHGWISNTNDEIINFIISHTTFKGDMPTYSTIRAELTRVSDLPDTKKFTPPED